MTTEKSKSILEDLVSIDYMTQIDPDVSDIRYNGTHRDTIVMHWEYERRGRFVEKTDAISVSLN